MFLLVGGQAFNYSIRHFLINPKSLFCGICTYETACFFKFFPGSHDIILNKSIIYVFLDHLCGWL